MSAYFITACGTGIGKTFTTCALIHAARAAGREVRAYKPVISGFDVADAESDTARIMGALEIPPPLGGRLGGGLPKTPHSELAPHLTSPQEGEELQRISPWRFAAPISPNMAAAREGTAIDFNALVNWSRTKIGGELTLIEGVGGAMVPLNDTHTVRDWIAALGIPAILVTGSYLGSISHTLTAIEALRAANIPIRTLIISESEGSPVPLDETLSTLNAFADDIPLRIVQPRVSSPIDATAIHALLEQLIIPVAK